MLACLLAYLRLFARNERNERMKEGRKDGMEKRRGICARGGSYFPLGPGLGVECWGGGAGVAQRGREGRGGVI